MRRVHIPLAGGMPMIAIGSRNVGAAMAMMRGYAARQGMAGANKRTSSDPSECTTTPGNTAA
jgi:hypothetical protein